VRFQYDETTYLSFEKNGRGDQILFLFHGFGLTKEVFRPWIDHLSNRFTIYSVDLFYHGDSIRPHGRLHKKNWKLMFEQFLAHEKIERFSVLGFSLGARFAICSAIELSNRCDHLYLVAPDAIYKTPWFKAATSFGLRWVFKYFMFHPNQMDAFIRLAVRLRIVSKYMADFVERELGKPENRKRVYISWNHFKPLGYNKRALRKAFTDASYDRTILVGTKDIVIPPNKVLPILNGCGFKVVSLDKKHHQMITAEVAECIANDLF
jgi:pimeloyl-ACP methyl ester carboxylesterase